MTSSGHALTGDQEPIARALEVGGPPYLVLAAQALFERVGAAPRSTLLPADAAAESDDDRTICGTAQCPTAPSR